MFYACLIKLSEDKYDSVMLCLQHTSLWRPQSRTRISLIWKGKGIIFKAFLSRSSCKAVSALPAQSLVPRTLPFHTAERCWVTLYQGSTTAWVWILPCPGSLFPQKPTFRVSAHYTADLWTLNIICWKNNHLILISTEIVGQLAIRGAHWDHEVFCLIPWNITININLTH